MPLEPFRIRFLLAWQAYERAVGRKVDGQAFAEALGVSRPLVSAWQEADTPPPHARILAIARVAGVDPGWLAYGSACAAPMAAVSRGNTVREGSQLKAHVKRTRGRLISEQEAARMAAEEEAVTKPTKKRRA